MTLQIHYRVFPVRYLTMGEIGYLQFSNVTFFLEHSAVSVLLSQKKGYAPLRPSPLRFQREVCLSYIHARLYLIYASQGYIN